MYSLHVISLTVTVHLGRKCSLSETTLWCSCFCLKKSCHFFAGIWIVSGHPTKAHIVFSPFVCKEMQWDRSWIWKHFFQLFFSLLISLQLCAVFLALLVWSLECLFFIVTKAKTLKFLFFGIFGTHEGTQKLISSQSRTVSLVVSTMLSSLFWRTQRA